jgi:uncharacterized membrane protein YjgN (DUF898 family)
MSLGDTPPGPTVLPIRFSGSGSEYFRIWIVNILLTLVTLGIYLPWAKVRRLRYFYANTHIGEHSFDFHGDPKKMLRGMLLVGAMLITYSIAGHFSPTAGLIAFLILAVIWPALFRTSMRFRLANTSWRGMRFRFTGDIAGAYRALLPAFVPGFGFLALGLMTAFDPKDPAHPPGPAFFAVMGLTVLVTFGVVPLIFWLVKKYQHGHYAFGQIETDLRAGPAPFYLLALKIIGMGLLVMIGIGTAAAVIGGIAAVASSAGGPANAAGGLGSGTMFLFFLVGMLVYVLMIALIYPYATSRSQNLVWNRTGSDAVAFTSELRFWPLVGLTFKNILLMIVTLGLYWPFARVALARMRLQAVTMRLAISPDELTSAIRAREDDASGDAAGDFFGFDIGL